MRFYSSALHLESEIHLVSYSDLCDLLYSSGLDLVHNKIEEKEEKAGMIKLIKVFQIIYILLLTFMFANVLLGFFGYAFTPLLWNPWLYLGAVTAFSHIWYRFYRKHAPNWKNLISVLLSLFAMVILVFFIELFFTFDGHGPVTIHSEY